MQDVLRLIVGGGLRTAGIGAAVGLSFGFAAARLVAAAIPGLRTDEIAVCAASAAILLPTALAACYLPARRAAKVSPMAALRSL